ncbi:MAG TPA: mechanosensitive ion channel family protein [Chitinophagaceae bacterium]|nr:mechanosensitive ion channel family protein [Chitinophagaceae bacterium]
MVSYIFLRFTGRGGEKMKQAKGILLIIRIFLWVVGVVFLLDNLGYNITTLVAGLGIGGIAIALAAQAVLADLFSYLVIFFDKPFETGDFIMVGDKSGVVEYIGIKTTRLRTLGGEQLIMSNTDLTNSRVQNFKRMAKRRVLITIGVTYETCAEKLKNIPSLVQEIVAEQAQVVFDRAHFSGFGDFSLNFEIVYYVLTDDYLQYMDSQQEFCLKLYDRFEQEHIDFAYPTQKILLT